MSAASGQPPVLPAGPRRPALMSPMVLSALVCPGAGQLMQRRWVTGTVFIVLFTGAFVWFVGRAYAVLKAYYAFAFDFKGATGQAPSVTAVMVPFGVCLVIYVAGLLDTALGSFRRRSTS